MQQKAGEGQTLQQHRKDTFFSNRHDSGNSWV